MAALERERLDRRQAALILKYYTSTGTRPYLSVDHVSIKCLTILTLVAIYRCRARKKSSEYMFAATFHKLISSDTLLLLMLLILLSFDSITKDVVHIQKYVVHRLLANLAERDMMFLRLLSLYPLCRQRIQAP